MNEYTKLLWFGFGALVWHCVVWFSAAITNWYRESHLRRMPREIKQWEGNKESVEREYKRLRQAR